MKTINATETTTNVTTKTNKSFWARFFDKVSDLSKKCYNWAKPKVVNVWNRCAGHIRTFVKNYETQRELDKAESKERVKKFMAHPFRNTIRAISAFVNRVFSFAVRLAIICIALILLEGWIAANPEATSSIVTTTTDIMNSINDAVVNAVEYVIEILNNTFAPFGISF